MIKEYSESVTIEVTPIPCERISWGDTKFKIKVDVEPEYATDDLDFPITLTWADNLKDKVGLEVGDAENIAKALLRAVEIRRAVVAAGLSLPNTGNEPQPGRLDSDSLPAIPQPSP